MEIKFCGHINENEVFYIEIGMQAFAASYDMNCKWLSKVK